MNDIIEIDLLEEKEFFEVYDKNLVSENLINFLIKQTPSYKTKNKLKIKINSNLDESIDLVNIIIKGLKTKYEKIYEIHKKNTIIQIIYLILGITIIFASTLLEGDVIREVVLICGWVLIWATVELEIFADIDGKKTRKKLKKLINGEFIVKKIK